MATLVTDLIGKTGVYITHGSGSILRRCKVIGFISPKKSAFDLISTLVDGGENCSFLEGVYEGAKTTWKNVSDKSSFPRYLIVTPKLTNGGEISKTGRQIMMAPNMFTFDIYFTPDSPEILEQLSTVNK
jgi:hypothetical protein